MKPAAFNQGWTYRDRVPRTEGGAHVSQWLAQRYPHSEAAVWVGRIAAGELELNGVRLSADPQLQGGETLAWCRPPGWRRRSLISGRRSDDGDLLVINKPRFAGDARRWLPASHAHGLVDPPVRGRCTASGGSSGLGVCPHPQTRALWSSNSGRTALAARCIRPGVSECPAEVGQSLTVSSDGGTTASAAGLDLGAGTLG